MQIEKLISPDYQKTLSNIHSTETWGSYVPGQFRESIEHARWLGVKNILDYGAGSGAFKNEIEKRGMQREFKVFEYDPCIERISQLPDRCEYIHCTDVFEHVEHKCILNVLDHIQSLMITGGYFSIALTPAHRVLEDGRNAHILLKSYDWWMEKLEERFKVFKFTIVKEKVNVDMSLNVCIRGTL